MFVQNKKTKTVHGITENNRSANYEPDRTYCGIYIQWLDPAFRHLEREDDTYRRVQKFCGDENFCGNCVR